MAESVKQRKLRILLADHDSSSQLLKAILEKNGYFVYCCKSGEEALGEIISNPYDLAIIDIQIPRLNVCNVAKHIKNFNNEIKIIITSGHSTPELERILSELDEEVDFESEPKPILVGNLLKKIDSLCC
jgi:CheY-like chemotaxis protein